MTDNENLSESRLAENEILYRRVNERIEDLNEALDVVASMDGEWVCECADANCATRITATIAEYESVRANPRRFIVAPGHVDREIEHVVRGNERFTVVEKEGVAAEKAELHDTRQR